MAAPVNSEATIRARTPKAIEILSRLDRTLFGSYRRLIGASGVSVMAATETIPVIDIGPYLAGQPGALERTARELHFALTEIGFYFIVNHGVAREKIEIGRA